MGRMAIVTLLITFNSRPAPLGTGNNYCVGRILKMPGKTSSVGGIKAPLRNMAM